ncbi:hypothetical protein VSDG_04824 [Cytospora chrysosperma]|uniref:C3H1-type domain-containing protein n=1 Tax=Cytospora chrysosperma TaxID=252740 RepID=A0A423W3L8_CYTCH|nr:hypothetical protein VSDG_04824 [Valsa sordida]
MSDEEQKLMEQISLLAGQINRAKNQQAGIASTSPAPGPSRSYGRGGYHRGHHAPYPVPGRGGYRIGKAPVRRHRSLILNNPSGPNNPSGDIASVSDGTSPSWVTRNDRHLQLINTNIYQEQTEARAKAIQQTRLQKHRQKEARERAQILNHLKRTADPSVVPANPTSAPVYEIVVEGIRFRVTNDGSKLVKVPGDLNGPKATPKMAFVGGVKFYRSKNGNMYRQAIVKAQRYVARSGDAHMLTTATSRRSAAVNKVNGPMCRFTHDPAKVSACKDLLQKGSCVAGDQCDLSHDLIPERTPHCAPVCRSFGFYGYCDKGISCPDRHAFECPDFSNTGICNTKGCKLPHRERASVLRKANAALEQTAADGDDGDLSSDDGSDSVSSDDVDSDEVEEFVGDQDSVDFDKDFISFN